MAARTKKSATKTAKRQTRAQPKKAIRKTTAALAMKKAQQGKSDAQPSWVVKQTYSKNYTCISQTYHDLRDFEMEPTGCYVLVKLRADGKLALAVVNAEHEIIREFRGTRPQDLYHAMEKDPITAIAISKPEHWAYIGKELQKAFFAKVQKTPYIQE